MFGKINFKLLTLITLCFVFIALGNHKALAADQKDSDLDGISDNAEITLYKTNPNLADTDNDGISDLREIMDKTDPTDANSSNLKLNNQVQLISSRDPVMWYLARISGIIAFLLFSMVVSFGLIMSSKSLLKFKFLSNPTAYHVHKLIALLALLVVVFHFSTFFFDDVLRLNVYQALIPFMLKSNIKSGLGFDLGFAMSLGIFAFYLGVILVVTSYFKNKIVSAKKWRMIHYSTFAFYILFMMHGFTSGTDSKEIWMQYMYIASLAVVTLLVLFRIFAKKLFYPKVQPKPVAPVVTNEIK